MFDYGPTCLAEITIYTATVDELTNEMICQDEYVAAPEDQLDWNQGFGPGEVPGCRRAVCECDKAQVKALKVISHLYSCIIKNNKTFSDLEISGNFCQRVAPFLR